MQMEVSHLTKRLYGVIHQAKTLVDNVGPDFQAI